MLKPGKRYDFSAIIKADNLVTQRKSPYQGLTIYVEGYDARGKWMFGDTARPAVAGTSPALDMAAKYRFGSSDFCIDSSFWAIGDAPLSRKSGIMSW